MKCYMIHLSRCVDRLPYIEAFEKALGQPIMLVEGVETGKRGCVPSHIKILKMFIDSGESHAMIFEDDVEAVGDLKEVLALSKLHKCDLFLLGATEYVDYTIDKDIAIVKRFWGTHAMIVNRRAAEKLIGLYDPMKLVPSDWYYPKVLSTMKIIGPKNPRQYVQQKEGVVSLFTGDIRSYS